MISQYVQIRILLLVKLYTYMYYISVRRVEGSYYFVSSLLVAFVWPTTKCLDEMALLFL